MLTAGAVQDFGAAIEIEPRYADTWKRRGQARSALGEVQGALTDLQKAIDLLPLWGQVRNGGALCGHCVLIRMTNAIVLASDRCISYMHLATAQVRPASTCIRIVVEFCKIKHVFWSTL